MERVIKLWGSASRGITPETVDQCLYGITIGTMTAAKLNIRLQSRGDSPSLVTRAYSKALRSWQTRSPPSSMTSSPATSSETRHSATELALRSDFCGPWGLQ